jgi:hypothetical protein
MCPSASILAQDAHLGQDAPGLLLLRQGQWQAQRVGRHHDSAFFADHVHQRVHHGRRSPHHPAETAQGTVYLYGIPARQPEPVQAILYIFSG